MKNKFVFILLSFLYFVTIFVSCSQNDLAQFQYESEAKTAKYRTDYAKVVNKLEMIEGNFESLRRVTFYNVRLGETVFVCEGFTHVQIDNDGDIELVVKVGEDKYLRHYLGQKQDITYFSEQLQPNKNVQVPIKSKKNQNLFPVAQNNNNNINNFNNEINRHYYR